MKIVFIFSSILVNGWHDWGIPIERQQRSDAVDGGES